MRYWHNLKIYVILLATHFFIQLQAQTTVYTGNVNGNWAKSGSPYLVEGDINIALGDTLVIQSGVVIVFKGNFLLNVQGTLYAKGAEKENILFTSADSIDFRVGDNNGWGGIRFDRRPVSWDTIVFSMPEDVDLKKIIEEQINNGNLDTTIKITLTLETPDLVNDTLLSDSIFMKKTGSQLEYCQFKYGMAAGRAQPYVFGGAIYIYRYSNLLISNCTFENNFAYAGGAIYCKEAAPMINNSTFKNCGAQISGGAMVFVHSGPIVYNNSLTNNKSGYNGGAMLFYESTPYVVNNKILNNYAYTNGGAIYSERNIDTFLILGKFPPVIPQKFKRDTTNDKTSHLPFSNQNASSFFGRFQNNIICNNKAMDGGAISLAATAPEFTNNTICNNMADSTCGGIYCYLSSPEIVNSIILGNKDTRGNSQVHLFGDSKPVINYCNIESGLNGIKKDISCKNSCKTTKIIDTPPLFKAPLSGNYELTKGSKCIDVGIPTASSLKLPSKDQAGKNRIVNKIIDLGALEYAPATAALSTADTLKEPQVKNASEGSDALTGSLKNGLNETYTAVYPNPADGLFSVAIHNNKYDKISIDVYSPTGQLIYKRDYNALDWFEEEVDLKGIVPGVYIVVVYSNENILYNGQLLIEQ